MKNDSNFIGLVFLGVLLTIFIASPKEIWRGGSLASDLSGSSQPGNSIGYSPNSSSGAVISSAPENDIISLGTGNAAYAYQPYEEYITIDNYGRNSVSLGGWQLKNGKDERPYYLNGSLQRFSADIAILPNITLHAGERAVVTSGKPSVQSPYPIANFKENMCTGYLESLPDYAFSPPLGRNCPRPADEPGVEGLERECREFIQTISSCETPVFDVKDERGDSCDSCIRGKRLSSHCAAFIKEHYSYNGCNAYHQGDRSFEGKTWRIFLNRGWEMWADKYETIELFNTAGQLVDYENY